MRVIAGRYKGRRLKTPTWEGVRPTSDKLRETLFNILAPRVEGARVLDGYAGTGAVGLEALSRGAAHVTFVERDRRAVALIEENARLCGVEGDYSTAPLCLEASAYAGATKPASPIGPDAVGATDHKRVNGYTIACGDFLIVAARVRAPGGFDLILLDPPYDIPNVREVLECASGLLSPDGLLVLERATRQDPGVPSTLARRRDVRSGDSTLTMFTLASARSGAPEPR